VALTPLLLQGWIPAIATLPEHAGLDHSAEAFYYAIFPGCPLEAPARMVPHLMKMARGVGAGHASRPAYMAFNPDGIAHPDRWSYGPWLWRSNIRLTLT